MGVRTPRLAAILGAALTLSLSIFFFACSEDSPTGASGDPDNVGQGQVDPSGSQDFMLGSVAVDGLPDGRIEVWAHNLTVASDNTVSFDVVLQNRSASTIYPPVMFFIPLIVPDHVHVLNSEIVYIATDPIRPGPPGFDFSDDLGDDNKLDPGEQSAPVTIMFGMDELTSFSIGFRIEVGAQPPDAFVVSGVVFHDANRNGHRDSAEPGIPGVRVTMTATTEDGDSLVLGPEILRTATTNERGVYGFSDADGGINTVTAFGPFEWDPTSPNPQLVTLLDDGSGGLIPVEGVNFGFAPHQLPPEAPIFGPVPVGPGSPNGSTFEGRFHIPDGGPLGVYLLEIIPPPILAPIDFFVGYVKVQINDFTVFEATCDAVAPGGGCVFGEQIEIPSRILTTGGNKIRIHLRGDERAFELFLIRMPVFRPQE